MWRKTRKPNYGTSCIGTDPNRNWSHKWGGECHWRRSFQLAVRSTTLVNTHWLPAKLWRCRAMQGAYIWNQRLRLQMHRSESEIPSLRNPPLWSESIIPTSREPNPLFQIRNPPVRICDSSFGTRNYSVAIRDSSRRIPNAWTASGI